MKHLLDQQLEAGIHGDFEKGWEIAQLMPEDDPRAQFNKGWYLLRNGKLLDGHRHLDYGRGIKCFGNHDCTSNAPLWDGHSKGVVLLNLEGGLGDQVNGVRWAKDISDRGCTVVVCCNPSLASIFVKVEGVSAVIQHEAMGGVYHDYWYPAMSAIVALEYEYEDLKGRPYIARTRPSSKGRVGVRWCGNPQFEHHQHRLFPAELMFDAVRAANCISLQKDEGSEKRPDWMKEVPLNNWKQTLSAICSCELVISSCTSVAHMAAAVGIPTWILVPILPYYLWALPGKKTGYYNSVTLFRQSEYGDWTNTFKELKDSLNNRVA